MMNCVSTSEELHNRARAGSERQASKENCIYHFRIKEHAAFSFQRGGKMDLSAGNILRREEAHDGHLCFSSALSEVRHLLILQT